MFGFLDFKYIVMVVEEKKKDFITIYLLMGSLKTHVKRKE